MYMFTCERIDSGDNLVIATDMETAAEEWRWHYEHCDNLLSIITMMTDEQTSLLSERRKKFLKKNKVLTIVNISDKFRKVM